MGELVELRDHLKPAEIMYVADAMSGQEAVNVARAFHEKLGVTGVIFSKIDGDARGGAALSIRQVTDNPRSKERDVWQQVGTLRADRTRSECGVVWPPEGIVGRDCIGRV